MMITQRFKEADLDDDLRRVERINLRVGDLMIVRSATQYNNRNKETGSICFGVFDQFTEPGKLFSVNNQEYTWNGAWLPRGFHSSNFKYEKLLVMREPLVLRKNPLGYGMANRAVRRDNCLKTDKIGVWGFGDSLDFIVGQRRIAKRLKTLEGFEHHAEWIGKLKKPYLEGY